MAETDAVVAIYWDFENVHACLIDDQTGEQTYRATAKYRAQDVVIDVARVAEYAAGHGRVLLSSAGERIEEGHAQIVAAEEERDVRGLLR